MEASGLLSALLISDEGTVLVEARTGLAKDRRPERSSACKMDDNFRASEMTFTYI